MPAKADATANMSAPSNVKDKFRTTCDGHQADIFCAHKPNGVSEFIGSESGLHIHDERTKLNGNHALSNTVEDNESRCSECQVKRAKKAQELHGTVGCPRANDFENMIENDSMNNCPVTLEDVEVAKDTHGKDTGASK